MHAHARGVHEACRGPGGARRGMEPPPKRPRVDEGFHSDDRHLESDEDSGDACRSAALVATGSHHLPADDIMVVTPAPPWSPRGAAGVALTRRHFWQLSVQPCDCSAHPIQRPRLTDEVVNAVLELEEAWCKQRGDRTTLILSSFFVATLGGTRGQPYNYERVRRWHSARKLRVRCGVSSILQLRSILVPVNIPYQAASRPQDTRAENVQRPLLQQEQAHEERPEQDEEEQRSDDENHWVLAEVQPARRLIRIFDSADAGTLTQASWDVLRALQRWLVDESEQQLLADESTHASSTRPSAAVSDKAEVRSQSDQDGGWTLERGESPQRQCFTGDCGVYMLANACILAESICIDSDSETRCFASGTAGVYSEADIPRWRTAFAAKLLGASAGHEVGGYLQ